ncbi:DUF2993 domain-containing protein [Coleofasciculus sp. H7-2]|uniref:LmeA family phospholipid-binding protein n=1 Tax=Coleofasciculus sp. H7-2 TaxID=3351545 RepID=UPI00366F544D
MLGGLTGFTNNTGTDWGERALNTVASKTIRHLFTQSESVEVAVRCYPSSKLLQGSIDSFKMSGRGLVIRREFRAEEMSFETDAVSIDFSGVMQGQIRLKQPTQAVVQVMVSQADINQSFQAELVQKRLQDISTPALTDLSGGQPVSFTEVEVQLLPENQVQIFAKADLGEKGVVPVSMKATLVVERRRRIRFKDPKFQPEAVPEESREISQTLTSAFAEILDNMVDLDRFNLDGVTIRINRLETQGDQLIFSGYAQIERVPNSP